MIEKLIAFVIMLGVSLVVWAGLLKNPIYKLQADKKKHLVISALIAIAIGCIAFFTKSSIWYFIGMGTSLGIGILKELADKFLHTGTPEFGDILADIAGSCVLAPFTLFSIALFINLFI